MEMGQDDHHGCDTGLVLGLGLGYSGGGGGPADRKRRRDPFPMYLDQPCLTLSLSDEAYGGSKVDDANYYRGCEERIMMRSSPHSPVSSFSTATAYPSSVKKERDVAGEEAEMERVSSRVSDEEEDGGARKKLRLTKEQSALLEDRFKEHSTLNPKQKQALAKQLNLRPRQVEVWFQNRRARTKLKQTEVDCEFLKRCCESLTDENRRLHKELQELKALKCTPPPPQLYMQLPPATLTMCPSCERIVGADDGTKGGGGGGGGAGTFVVAPNKAHFFNPFSTTHPAAC